jgi:ribonuclease PH
MYKLTMKAIVILDKYTPYLIPGKLYEVEQSQIESDIYFVVTDNGSTTSVHISQLSFLDEIRDEKLYKLLEIKDV